MSSAAKVAEFDLEIEQVDGYQFRVKFDKEQYADLLLDEPHPLSGDVAPNASRILAASIGNCLSASLVFCMARAGAPIESIRTQVHVELVRNQEKRLRVGQVAVKLMPKLGQDGAKYAKCLETFEDFCVVTQSVRQGLDVTVSVEPV
ncbi:MAG: OsmC family protein [Polyangiaceae bacterium]|nr:OsmC family protein [Polyangiaceae bacterium]